MARNLATFFCFLFASALLSAQCVNAQTITYLELEGEFKYYDESHDLVDLLDHAVQIFPGHTKIILRNRRKFHNRRAFKGHHIDRREFTENRRFIYRYPISKHDLGTDFVQRSSYNAVVIFQYDGFYGRSEEVPIPWTLPHNLLEFGADTRTADVLIESFEPRKRLIEISSDRMRTEETESTELSWRIDRLIEVGEIAPSLDLYDTIALGMKVLFARREHLRDQQLLDLMDVDDTAAFQSEMTARDRLLSLIRLADAVFQLKHVDPDIDDGGPTLDGFPVFGVSYRDFALNLTAAATDLAEVLQVESEDDRPLAARAFALHGQIACENLDDAKRCFETRRLIDKLAVEMTASQVKIFAKAYLENLYSLSGPAISADQLVDQIHSNPELLREWCHLASKVRSDLRWNRQVNTSVVRTYLPHILSRCSV